MIKIGDVLRLKIAVEWHDTNYGRRKPYAPGETFLYTKSGIVTHLKTGDNIPLSNTGITTGSYFEGV